jgi:hypothetical protein
MSRYSAVENFRPALRTQEYALGTFQSPLRDLFDGACQPRTTSWAKISRPCGTQLEMIVLVQAKAFI